MARPRAGAPREGRGSLPARPPPPAARPPTEESSGGPTQPGVNQEWLLIMSSRAHESEQRDGLGHGGARACVVDGPGSGAWRAAPLRLACRRRLLVQWTAVRTAAPSTQGDGDRGEIEIGIWAHEPGAACTPRAYSTHALPAPAGGAAAMRPAACAAAASAAEEEAPAGTFRESSARERRGVVRARRASGFGVWRRVETRGCEFRGHSVSTGESRRVRASSHRLAGKQNPCVLQRVLQLLVCAILSRRERGRGGHRARRRRRRRAARRPAGRGRTRAARRRATSAPQSGAGRRWHTHRTEGRAAPRRESASPLQAGRRRRRPGRRGAPPAPARARRWRRRAAAPQRAARTPPPRLRAAPRGGPWPRTRSGGAHAGLRRGWSQRRRSWCRRHRAMWPPPTLAAVEPLAESGRGSPRSGRRWSER